MTRLNTFRFRPIAFIAVLSYALFTIGISPTLSFGQTVTITVKTDSTNYYFGQSVLIGGRVSSVVPGNNIAVQVYSPSGATYKLDVVTPNSAGYYSYNLVLGGPLATEGTYRVGVSYSGATAETTFNASNPPAPERPFGPSYDVLIIGDSIIWGQGLLEEHKFDQIMLHYIRTIVGEGLPVVQSKFAHSGAHIGAELPDVYDPTRDGPQQHGEIPETYPTVIQQINFYEGDPDELDLILVGGCIDDLDFTTMLDTSITESDLTQRTQTQCRDHMEVLLENIMTRFTNPLSKIIVTGYFPVITSDTDMDDIPNVIMFHYGIIESDGPVLVRNWDIFNRVSSQSIQDAVDAENTALLANGMQQRIFFVNPNFQPENGIYASHPLLWQPRSILGTVHAQDEVAEDVREPECERLYGLVSFDTVGCNLASTGHPNVEGASKYANAVRSQLRTILQMPTAVAGPDQTVRSGAIVNLDGSYSHKYGGPPGGLASYRWDQIGVPSVSLHHSNQAIADFTAPSTFLVRKELTFQLIVNDGTLNSFPDRIKVTVCPNSGSCLGSGHFFGSEAGNSVFQVEAETKMFNVTINGEGISDAGFSSEKGAILLENDGTSGLLEVEIPKELMSGNFTVIVDDKNIEYKASESETYSTIILDRPSNSTMITIQGTNVIPEFPLPVMILTGLMVTILLVFVRRRHFL
jgi:hypothetical protein